ncbi:aminotransferase class V-fold PLP-dependent enzyme [Microlunatus panaciterrae]|uniref:Glutamate/tyrosine decarboxylase-like PLP-dependent enzyme n=1 Tax=Microlunatus panaciterrae TaxID=400768 RepID=A0ABS2RLA1_9ACTN|nr:aminotransferase class V-fold PLP-dependent enzyme [Microlunatus panaciterrae]MBM7799796.1 glutamate/tyrosine decarboxylase-like PLP-dependent enzyme [Microlunatus panaciterrae]
MSDERQILEHVLGEAAGFLAGLHDRPVAARSDVDQVATALGGPLPEDGEDGLQVIEELIAAAEPGLVAMPSGRFFGWVIGGTLPAALGADWLTSAWDQNAGLLASSPAAAGAERVAAGWLLDLLRLPATAGVGFVTGAMMANFTGLASARHEVLRRVGWDVDRDGLVGAPPVRVVVGEERHDTIDAALRYLGLGQGRSVVVPADGQGRLRPEALSEHLDRLGPGPLIVALQAGNVNSGAFDPLEAAIETAHRHGAWVHVDGAFGLWAAASPRMRGLVHGLERADSWATDAHKTLNVPYDSGIAVVADAEALYDAMGVHAAYLIQDERPDPMASVPEFSRRARGFAVWAALRSLGRNGVAELVERFCGHAQRFAALLAEIDGARVVNDVVFTQVCVSFGADEVTREVARRLLAEGTAWMTPSVWQGRAILRISVSNWRTTDEDVDRTLEAVRRVVAEVRSAAPVS